MVLRNNSEGIGTNRPRIKEDNTRLMLQLLIEHGPIARIDLSKITKLSRTAVSSIVNGLVENGLLEEVGVKQTDAGKKPRLLDLSKNAGFILGIDLGGTSGREIIVALLDLRMKVIQKIKRPLSQDQETSKLEVFNLIDIILRKLGKDKDKILGIGIASSGVLDLETGSILFSIPLQWESVNLKEELEVRFGLPAILEREANAALLAELWKSNSQRPKNAVYVSVGAGVGAGVLLDGNLLRGYRERATEFGHTKVALDGPKCDCGTKGCLEALVSPQSICSCVTDAIKNGRNSILKDRIVSQMRDITLKDVLKASKEGDALSKEMLMRSAEYIGIGLSNLINLLSPEICYVGGVSVLLTDDVIKRIKEVALTRSLSYLSDEITICSAKFGEDNRIVGIGSLVLKKRIGALLNFHE